LMTKAMQGLYAAPFLLLLPYMYRDKKVAWKILSLFTIAFALAAPWHIYMSREHPEFYDHLTASLDSLRGGTYALQGQKHRWYHLNQLVVNLPFLGIIY